MLKLFNNLYKKTTTGDYTKSSYEQTFFVSLNSSLLSNGAAVFKYFCAVSANVGTGNLIINKNRFEHYFVFSLTEANRLVVLMSCVHFFVTKEQNEITCNMVFDKDQRAPTVHNKLYHKKIIK